MLSSNKDGNKEKRKNEQTKHNKTSRNKTNAKNFETVCCI
jgi:hypothetical protein